MVPITVEVLELVRRVLEEIDDMAGDADPARSTR